MVNKKIVIAVLCVLAIVSVFYSCKDMGSNLSQGALLASSLSVTLSPGGNATVTISGGNPPYSISRQPSASLVSAALFNNANGTARLDIQAVSANVSGSTSLKIKDTEAPQSSTDGSLHDENEIEISIRVGLVSFASEIQPIFTQRCVNPGCHPGNGAPFPLAAGPGYNQLVNVNATTGPCAGIKRVLPGDPDNSALVKRLEGTCGSQMPLSGSPLSSGELQLIRSWITQGAQNN